MGAFGRSTPASKVSTSSNAAVSVFLRVRPPGTPGADADKRSGRRTYQILEDQATLRTFPPLSAGHSRTINRQVYFQIFISFLERVWLKVGAICAEGEALIWAKCEFC